MILSADAAVEPGTMMIESVYTSVAGVAMPRAWSLYQFTEGTKGIRLKLFEESQEINCGIFNQIARVTVVSGKEHQLRYEKDY